MPATAFGIARLSLLFSLIGLLASRLGLLVHEFVGHGGAAKLLGGEVVHWRLFLFGGGWIQYRRTPWYADDQLHVIALAGVGLEALLALALFILSSRARGDVGRVVLRCLALLLAGHACMYLALGTHYGFGDGRLLHQSLGPWRGALVAVLAALLLCLAYATAREGFWASAMTLRRHRIAGTIIAVLVGAGLHLALFQLEGQWIDGDQTYAAIMQKEVSRRAQDHVARVEILRRQQGRALTAPEAERERLRYVEEHEPWPLRPVLFGLCGLAALLALLRHRSRERDPLLWSSAGLWFGAGNLALLLGAIAAISALG